MSDEMTFLDHIEELRWRIVKIFIGMIVPVIVAMIFYEELFILLKMPITSTESLQKILAVFHLEAMLPDMKREIILQAINPTDTFLTALKIAFTVGLFASFPFTIYQIWAFVSPALSTDEKKHTLPVVFFATLFFITGGAFAYFIVTPFAFNFFASFANGLVENQWGVAEYFDQVLKFLITFGLIFELPCIAFVLARLGLITPAFLREYRRYAIVVILVLSSILTPPDIVSQFMMGVPLYGLYEVSILIVAIFRPKSPFDEE